MGDFDYKERDNDRSILFIRYKEWFFGYDNVEPTTFSDELVELKNEIVDNKEIMDYANFSKSGIDLRYVKASAKIWNELGIKLQKVQYLEPSYVFDEVNFDGNLDMDFYDKLKLDYPTKIPVNYVNDYKLSSTHALYLELKHYNAVVFRNIKLPKIEKKINSSIYAHELTHVAQESSGGGIRKLTNLETLPIFIEFLFANKIDDNNETLNILINHRLCGLSKVINDLLNDKDMDFENRIVKETYIISIMQALDLFNKYKEGNESTKKEIIELINNIFIGEKVIEQVLDNYDSNIVDINPKLKVLKK